MTPELVNAVAARLTELRLPLLHEFVPFPDEPNPGESFLAYQAAMGRLASGDLFIVDDLRSLAGELVLRLELRNKNNPLERTVTYVRARTNQ